MVIYRITNKIKGKKKSEETKQKMCLAKLGKPSLRKGTRYKKSKVE